MNWEAVGAISEAIGVIAIFVSLIYVAIQIRQNTQQSSRSVEATQLAAFENNIESSNRLRELLLMNPELLQMVRKGYTGLGNLNALEQAQFGLLIRNIFSSMQATYIRHIVVGHHDDAVDGSIKTLDGLLENPGIREWLAENDTDWRSEFRELVESRLTATENQVEQDGSVT